MSRVVTPSPLPWWYAQYAGTCGIDDANGSCVADAVNPADGALILRAVNNHASLLEACEALVAAWDSLPEDADVPAALNTASLWDQARRAIAAAQEGETP